MTFDLLFNIADYPPVLTITTSGKTAINGRGAIGVYKIDPKTTHNNRPVWENVKLGTFYGLFYNGMWKNYAQKFT